MAAKKKGSKGQRVTIEVDSSTLEALIRAAEALGEIAVAVRSKTDDASTKSKSAKKKKKGDKKKVR